MYRMRRRRNGLILILREILAEKDFDCGKRLSWLNRDSSSFKKGLTVTTFYLAKGLEFDQVFSIFPKDEKREMMMRRSILQRPGHCMS